MSATTQTAARLLISALATIKAKDPAQPDPVNLKLENDPQGQRWTAGTGSGEVDRPFMYEGALAAAATDSYDLVAAGALEDIFGQAIDADELKGIVVECVTGQIEFRAPAANGLSIFTAVSEGLQLEAGHMVGFDLGDDGIEVSVSTNSKFDVVDTFGGVGSTYKLWAVVAQ